MLLVTCREVIGDLIKNGPNRNSLVSHRTSTLEWGSSIFQVLTWRTWDFFLPFCFASFRVLVCPKLTVLMTENCQQNFVTCRWPLLKAERKVFCVSLFRMKKTFLKCTSSWLPFTSYWLVLVWHISSKNSHWQEQYGWLGTEIHPLWAERGPAPPKAQCSSYLGKLVFSARKKGEMYLGIVSWLGVRTVPKTRP